MIFHFFFGSFFSSFFYSGLTSFFVLAGSCLGSSCLGSSCLGYSCLGYSCLGYSCLGESFVYDILDSGLFSSTFESPNSIFLYNLFFFRIPNAFQKQF